jgi:hypothetical protein
MDAAIRQRARREGKSLNAVAVSALAQGLGLDNERLARRNVSDIVGTWRRDPGFDAARAAQDQVDENLWK